MPTNPAEWRGLLQFAFEHFEIQADKFGKLADRMTGAFLRALLREWDAHAPEFEEHTGDGAWRCPLCFDEGDADGLCPARRRMMGGGDGD